MGDEEEMPIFFSSSFSFLLLFLFLSFLLPVESCQNAQNASLRSPKTLSCHATRPKLCWYMLSTTTVKLG